ncbi:NAD(P)H-dependent oxidoreductase [Tumebacillus avium]|uniref:NAD(P)H-dependent oxidoreductase n=1 Tax=Tumebacillus avium TaxID=1903704 RepID=UPI000B3B48F0|nr:NAD(P)H-dependent oxidoreductase [Tumebacillus avium]
MAVTKEQILEAYQFRHACKAFDPAKKISDEDFNFLLETGRLSPSSFGFEPWKFVVVQNMELRERLKPVSWGAQGQLPTASHFVIVLARTKGDLLPDSAFIQHMMREVHQMPEEVVGRFQEIYRNFQDNEFKLNEHDRLFFEWACRQAYIAIGNMMTAAALIGIDSCPVEGFDRAAVEEILTDAGVLKGNLSIACMVAFGYRAEDPGRPKSRQAMEDVVEWVR